MESATTLSETIKTRSIVETDKVFHSEQFVIHNGEAMVKILHGFYLYNRFDNSWLKPNPKPKYISVSERGFVKKIRLPIVLREDHEERVAGYEVNKPIFSKIMFTVTVREDRNFVYLLQKGRKLYIRDFAGLGSTEECGFNSDSRIVVKEGKATGISREQAIELTEKGSPFYMGLLRKKDGSLVWIQKVTA